MSRYKSERNGYTKQLAALNKNLLKSVETIRGDITTLSKKNEEDISKNKSELSIHSKELEEGRKERELMKAEILTLKSQMADQKRHRSKSIVVMTGAGMPPQDGAEDPFEVAKECILMLTDLVIEKQEVKTCHRTGPNGANMLIDFLYTGPGSTLDKILQPQHKTKSHLKKIFLNLHQQQADRKLFFIARRMVKAGLIEKAFVNSNATTVVVKNKVKTLIMKRDDFKKVTDKDVSTFEKTP